MADEPLAEAGDADGRRPHVHAAAPAAQVERDAVDVDEPPGAHAGLAGDAAPRPRSWSVRALKSSMRMGL